MLDNRILVMFIVFMILLELLRNIENWVYEKKQTLATTFPYGHLRYHFVLKTLMQNSSETKLHFNVYWLYHYMNFRWNMHFSVIHNLTVFSDKPMVSDYQMTIPPLPTWRNLLDNCASFNNTKEPAQEKNKASFQKFDDKYVAYFWTQWIISKVRYLKTCR